MLGLIVLIALKCLHPAPAECPYELHVTGIEQAAGLMQVAIYLDSETFMSEQPYRLLTIPVEQEAQLTVCLNDLAPGQYAFSIFHDVNANWKLDKNLVGIPTEPIGFSNDARATFGPPAFDAARVTLDRAHPDISIGLY